MVKRNNLLSLSLSLSFIYRNRYNFNKPGVLEVLVMWFVLGLSLGMVTAHLPFLTACLFFLSVLSVQGIIYFGYLLHLSLTSTSYFLHLHFCSFFPFDSSFSLPSLTLIHLSFLLDSSLAIPSYLHFSFFSLFNLQGLS